MRLLCLLCAVGCGGAPPPEPVAVTPVAEPEPEPTPAADPECAEQTSEDPLAAPASVAAPPAGVRVDENGLASCVIRPGTGAFRPHATSQVTVHYSGWTTDGQLFDSSHQRGEPATFGLNQVIQGWTEGVLLMVEGEKRRLWIPQDLAYQGRPGRPQGMLVFDVELLSVQE